MDSIAKLDEAIQLFQKYTDRDLTLASVRLLSLLQVTPGLHQEALAEKVGVSTAHCSLLLYALADKRRRMETGHGLVEAIVDEDNRRRKKMFLTDRGRALMRKVNEVLGAASSS